MNESEGQKLYELLEPQSHHLIGFDEVLLLQWKPIGPPTSLTSARRYLTLTDHFAQGRGFFDDDPKQTLARFGITERDFSVNRPWDAYPMVGHLLRVWDGVEVFLCSSPYEFFIPEGGFESNLFFDGGPKAPRNAALIRLRNKIHCFIHDYDPVSPQYSQWPLSIET